MLGDVINGKYKLETAFSESRMYEVFTATEVETGATVIVKLMKPEIISNRGIVNNFCSEVKSFAGLSHPSIAEVLDIDMFEDRPFVVSPFVNGVALNEYLQDNVLPYKECLNIVAELGSILQYAFEQKVECRTIKLSNVLRMENGKIKLLSFTQPRLRSVSSLSSKNEKTGFYSDLYFLGITLYELLGGESPIRVRGGLYELWDMKLEQLLRIRHIEMSPEQVDKIVDFIRKTISRDETIRFKSYEEYINAVSELSGQVKKNNVARKKDKQKQLCIASQVVDALNGVSNVLPSFTVTSKPASKSVAVASLKDGSEKSKSETQMGTVEFKTEGTLALAVDNSEKFDSLPDTKVDSIKPHRPELRLVKPLKNSNKTINKVNKISKKEVKALEWQDEGMSLKNPVIYMGLLLAIMVALILFW